MTKKIRRYNPVMEYDAPTPYPVMDLDSDGEYVSTSDAREVVDQLLTIIQQKLDPFLLTEDEELLLKAIRLEWAA